MNFFRPLVCLVLLLLLTALLCWITTNLLAGNPLCGIGVLVLGILGVVVATDAISEGVFHR